MHLRDRLSLALPPLLLRIALAAVFIWAGTGKLLRTQEYAPEQAAILANAGAIEGPLAGPGPDGADGAEEAPAQEQPDDQQEQTEQSPNGESAPGQPSEPLPEPPADESDEDTTAAAHPGAPTVILAQNSTAQQTYTAEDFSGPVEARGLYNIFLLLKSKSEPSADGARPLVPAALAKDNIMLALAWTAGLTEFFAGLFILVGLVTRLCGLALAGVMATAIWLTSIGPIVFGGPDTTAFLAFLPPLDQFRAWQTLMFQFITLAAALAVFFSRPGLLAIDGLLFGSSRKARRKDAHETEE